MVARRRFSVGPPRLPGDPLPLARGFLGRMTSMWRSELGKSSRSPICSTWAHGSAVLLTCTNCTWISRSLSTGKGGSRTKLGTPRNGNTVGRG
eukprot:904646-Pyramimonas_sp.AAC.1